MDWSARATRYCIPQDAILEMVDPNAWHTREEGVPDAKAYKSSEYPITAVPSTIASKGDSNMGRVLTTEEYCTRMLAWAWCVSWAALRKAVTESGVMSTNELLQCLAYYDAEQSGTLTEGYLWAAVADVAPGLRMSQHDKKAILDSIDGKTGQIVSWSVGW